MSTLPPRPAGCRYQLASGPEVGFGTHPLPTLRADLPRDAGEVYVLEASDTYQDALRDACTALGFIDHNLDASLHKRPKLIAGHVGQGCGVIKPRSRIAFDDMLGRPGCAMGPPKITAAINKYASVRVTKPTKALTNGHLWSSCGNAIQGQEFATDGDCFVAALLAMTMGRPRGTKAS